MKDIALKPIRPTIAKRSLMSKLRMFERIHNVPPRPDYRDYDHLEAIRVNRAEARELVKILRLHGLIE